MQSCSRLFRSYKHQGHSFSVLQHFCRRCKLMTQTEYVLGNYTPCNSIPFIRQVSSWDDSKVKKLDDRKRYISKASVLRALADKETDIENMEKNEISRLKLYSKTQNLLTRRDKYKENKSFTNMVKEVFSRDEPSDTLPDSVKKGTDNKTDNTEARKHKAHLSENLNSVVQSNKEALQRFCNDLMVPFDGESTFSASIALHHLCEMTEEGTSIFGDGKHAPVIDELLDLVQQKIATIDDTLVADFVIFNFKVIGFPHSLFRVASNKFKFSMNSNKYTLLTLLDISSKLQSFDSNGFDELKSKQFESILTSIWDLISLREKSITYSVLAKFYKGAPVKHKKIFSTLQTSLCTWIYEQDFQDVLDILNVKQKTMQAEKLEVISKWVKSTLDVRTVNELEKLMNGYLQCEHVCPVMVGNLPSIADLANSKSTMTTKLICQLVSYCANGLYKNDYLLKMACKHYVDNTNDYTSENLHTLLHAIGVLNFLPPMTERLFFSKVEDYLTENFYKIDVSMLLEIFVYLLYVNRVAINFASHIFSPLLLGIVFEFEEEKRMKAVQNLELIRNVCILRGVKNIGLISDIPHRIPPSYHHSSTTKATHIVTDALYNIVGRGQTVGHVRRPASMMEQYIELDYMELAQWAGVDFPEPRGKFIILPISEESFCKNTNIMIGPESTNLRILTEQGHTVAELHLDKIEELASTNQLSAFLKSLLMQQVLEKDITEK